MTLKPATEPSDVPETLAEGLALQAAGLDLLRAEMEALAAIMQVAVPHPSQTQDEIDAEFDNLPV